MKKEPTATLIAGEDDPWGDNGSKVYAAICRVAGDLSVAGIGKDRNATGGGANYAFRGIDDVYNALAPLLAKHKLCMLPRVLSRTSTERASKSGGVLFLVVVEVEFDLVSGEDGSKHTIRTIGEAMDSGDKATNKAMSAAYKYAAFMAFAIPTEGAGHDTEEQTHAVAPPDYDNEWLVDRDAFEKNLLRRQTTLEEVDVERAKVGKPPCRQIGHAGRVTVMQSIAVPPKKPAATPPREPGSDG